MRTSCFAALMACGLAATATAQIQVTPEAAPTAVFAGTYHVMTGRFTPASSTTNFGAGCSNELIFNQSAQSGFFFNAVANGGTGVTDEGIIPDGSAGGNAGAYQVNTVVIGYVTDHTTVDATIDLWEAGGDCASASGLGAPTGTAAAPALPGTSTAGSLEALIVAIDLSGGAEFMMAGSDGATKFNYQITLGGTGGTTAGPLLCGDPDFCAEGAGTFADTGVGCDGLGTGSGLGEADLFQFEPDVGCFWFGGYPGAPFASYYLQIQGGLTGDVCGTAGDLGNLVGTQAYDTTCASTSGNNPCTSMSNDLFFTWTAPNDGDYTFDTCGTSYDTKLAVLSDCASCIGSNDDSCGLQSAVIVGGMTAGDSVILQVGGFGSGDSGPGVLNITEFIDPCAGSSDALEDNDVCIDAVVLGSGSVSGLRIESADDDYYSINVPDGATLTAEIKFLNANGDTDIFLYENLGNCQADEGPGTHGCGNTLDCGFSVSDNESASWTNASGAAVDVLVQIKLWSSGTCNDYDLVLNVNAGGDVGTNYCHANANSSGVPAKMSASGSADTGLNDLVLECNNMPTIAPLNIWNYFAVGTAQDYVVLAVEQGNLCIGGNVARFTGPGEVTNAGATGSASLAVDQNALPGGLGAPLPGDTLYFTNYYRDVNPSPTSNLADGLC